MGSARVQASARIRSRYRRTRTLLLLAAYLLPAACCSAFLPLPVSSLSLASTLVSAQFGALSALARASAPASRRELLEMLRVAIAPLFLIASAKAMAPTGRDPSGGAA